MDTDKQKPRYQYLRMKVSYKNKETVETYTTAASTETFIDKFMEDLFEAFSPTIEQKVKPNPHFFKVVCYNGVIAYFNVSEVCSIACEVITATGPRGEEYYEA